MPRYFFHEKNHPDSDDLRGAELKDDAAARQEAVLRMHGGPGEWPAERGADAIEVKDEAGRLLFKVSKDSN